MKKFLIPLVASIGLTSCSPWYSLQNFLGIRHYEIVTNAENWLDNNRYDSINNKWVGPDSTRLNFLEKEAKKEINDNNKKQKNDEK